MFVDDTDYDEKHSFYIGVESLSEHNLTTVYMSPSRKQVRRFNINHAKLHINFVDVTGCFDGFTCDEVAYLAYDNSLSEVACQQWDDVNEVWGSDSCDVLPGNTATQTRFKSNLFGSLGAGISVAPNTIDFNTVFNNLDQKLIEVRPAS